MTRARRIIVALVLAVVSILLTPAVASAHAILEGTTPGQGAQVDAAPTSVVLRFSESVGVSSRSIQVFGPKGQRVDNGSAKHVSGQDNQVTVGFSSALGRESYTVVWHVVSADSHPIGGSFAFGVGVPASQIEAPSVQGDTVVKTLHAVFRGLAFLGLLLLVGGITFLIACWPGGIDVRGVRRLLIGSWASAGVATLALLFLQGPYGAGLGLSQLFSGDLLSTTLATRYGKLALVRLFLLVLLIPLARQLASSLRKRERPTLIDLVGLGVLGMLTFSLGGHPGQGIQVPLAVTLDAVHLVSAGVWLGGLVILAGWALRVPDHELHTMLPRWSLLAQGSVALLVATGLYASWRQVATFPAYLHTNYGVLLLVKSGLVLGMLALAWRAHLRVVRLVGHPVGLPVPGFSPRLVAHASVDLEAAQEAPTPSANSGLRRPVLLEALLGIVVVAVTAVLVNTVPARDSYAPSFDKSVVATGVAGDTIDVVVNVPKTKTGSEVLHVYTDKKGVVLPTAEITGTLAKDGSDLRVPMTFGNTGPGHGTATNVNVLQAGRWTLTIQIRVDDTHSYAAETSYLVR